MLSKIPAQSRWLTCLHTTRVGASSGSKHTKPQNQSRFWLSSLEECTVWSRTFLAASNLFPAIPHNGNGPPS